MLIHKYKMDEFVPIYHELQALNHQDRECGPAGLTLQDTEDYDCQRCPPFFPPFFFFFFFSLGGASHEPGNSNRCCRSPGS